ncbi:MAG: sugar phosphate isomerase/epimerase [Planctomycetes bacterium]|nr:sugar phosphate isomerase/epimerase [Planctomycetota bacterium]
MPQSNRRTFLHRAAVASGAAVGGLAGSFAPSRARAVEPVQREGKMKVKFTLAAYSYRNLLSGKDASMSLEDFVRDCARFGLEGTEPTSYYFPEPVTNDYLCRLKALAFRLGLGMSSTAVRNNFCLPPGEARDKDIAHVKQWIDHAQVLGTPVIRIFSGGQIKGQSPEEAHRLVVEGIEECSAYAGQKGIYLGLENHGGMTATADGHLAIVRDVKSPWFGAWMDSGNFHEGDPYAELEKIAPYSLHVQVKVVTREKGKEPQPMDFQRLRKILEGIGYRGWICLEYEEKENPRQACPRYLDQLREAFA